MPRGPKIGPALARQWLEEYDQGRTQDQLATKYRRTKRSIADNIERARQERRFDQVKREQLGRALERHEEDLIGLVGYLRRAVAVPSLQPPQLGETEFGLPGRGDETEEGQSRVSFGPGLEVGETWGVASEAVENQGRPITVIAEQGRPLNLELSVESSPLFGYLRQHLKGDRLWRELTVWQTAYLEELQARAHLNTNVSKQATQILNAPVRPMIESSKPSLTTALPPFVRYLLMKTETGEHFDLDDQVAIQDSDLMNQQRIQTLGSHLGPGAKKQFKRLLSVMEGSDSLKVMAETHHRLSACAEKVAATLDGYLLLHYIRGSCGLCKKLGGR